MENGIVASIKVFDAPGTLNNQLIDWEPTPDTDMTNFVFELCMRVMEYSKSEFIYLVCLTC